MDETEELSYDMTKAKCEEIFGKKISAKNGQTQLIEFENGFRLISNA